MKKVERRTSLTIAAAQARKPRERMPIKESFVRRLTFKLQTTGIGRTAKKKSVMMLMAKTFG